MSDKYDEMARGIVTACGIRRAESPVYNDPQEHIAAAIRKAVAEAKREFGEECATLVDDIEDRDEDWECSADHWNCTCVSRASDAIRAKVAEIQ